MPATGVSYCKKNLPVSNVLTHFSLRFALGDTVYYFCQMQTSTHHHKVTQTSTHHQKVTQTRTHHHKVTHTRTHHHKATQTSTHHHKVTQTSTNHHKATQTSIHHHKATQTSTHHHKVTQTSTHHHKVTQTSTHHHKVTQNSVTALKVLCTLRVHPFPSPTPGNHASFLSVYFLLHWVFVTLLGLLLAVASLVVSTRSRAHMLQ